MLMEYHLTMKDVKKYEILKQVTTKQLKGTEAAILLGCHPVHISRLKKKVIASGIQGILRPKLPSNRKHSRHSRKQPNPLFKRNLREPRTVIHFFSLFLQFYNP